MDKYAAREALQEAAKKGNTMAQAQLKELDAEMNLNTTEKESITSHKNYAKMSKIELRRLYEDILEQLQDSDKEEVKKGIQQLKELAEFGYPRAQYAMGELLRCNNQEEAMKWFKLAAPGLNAMASKTANPNVMRECALCYEYTKDFSSAFHLWLALWGISRSSDAYAIYKIGVYRLNGWGEFKQIDKPGAFDAFRRAVELGYAPAIKPYRELSRELGFDNYY